MTPFQALYGYPPSQLGMDALETPVAAVEQWLGDKKKWNDLLKENFVKAQNRMKQFADKVRSERSFQVGDLVYLKLQPYKQTSVAIRRNLKLSSKYYERYRVLQKVRNAAYTLELPSSSLIHPTFHVSLLKPSTKIHEVSKELPLTTTDGL
ncbi:uncharacterized protein LOC113766060 [Coffea eugenioides]|uniref:uncharacterized protein LOC113766060 n=1 Tax=Coffea eugenioides TaxID=49369 RepID=UPI000F612B69|nr:uncharacterized protein LOC113766060 [Coffea eugenioides]